MRTKFMFIVLLGLASALPLGTNKNVNLEQLKETLLTAEEGARLGIVETTILEILEQLRALMISGSDNIPVLDPVLVENINIDGGAINMPGSYIRINGLSMRDLSTFEMESIEFSVVPILRFRLAFDLSIPAINVNANSYDMHLNVLGGQVYGTGNMSLRIVKPRVKGHVVVGLRVTADGTFLQIRETQISIGLDDFQPVISGMFNNQASSDFVSAFLRNLVRELLEFFEVDITNFVSGLVIDIGNSILADFDLADLLPFEGELTDLKQINN